jgi:arylsulfatase A-like enzyme
MTMAPPNIIVAFSDQQRWDTLGCYGQPLPVTPHLDRMAAEGVRFANAFTNQPVCGPTRAVVQTGRYATEVGCWRNDLALPTDAPTIARLLSSAGYETGYIGKWHLASTGGQQNHHFTGVPRHLRGGYLDHWLASDVLEFTSHGYDGHLFDADERRVDFTGYRVDALTEFALDYLRGRDRRRPFFLFLSYIEPHHQNDRDRYEGPEGSKERWRDFVPPADLAGTGGDWREQYPDYLGCVHALDGGVGRIRAELARLGLAEDTLVIYTSDHGNHFRTRNGEYKRSCHDGSIRIPMLACGPGFRGGRTVERLVSLIDLAPTLAWAGGAVPPRAMRGRPLHEALSAAAWMDEVLVQISESQVGRALRDGRWKYGVTAPGLNGWDHAAASAYREEFLYDLAADPHERRNLVAEPTLTAVRADLASRLRRRLVAIGEPPCEIGPCVPEPSRVLSAASAASPSD